MQKEITFIGLGRMGAAMTELLLDKGYTIHGFDQNQTTIARSAGKGVLVHKSARDAVNAQKNTQKIIWLMVPSQFVDEVVEDIEPELSPQDIVIDGGNSFFQDSLRRFDELKKKQINFVDCGTSGGVEGARHGASLMVGGEQEIVQYLDPLFADLATEDGYAHVGGPSAGHFVKMVHNGIEYGMMGAIAEGINILKEHEDGLSIDLNASMKPYEHGSIIEGSLMSWLADSINSPGYLNAIMGEVPKGETEMEMEYLIKHEQVEVLAAALEQRKKTRKSPSFTGKLIAAMRNQFGGHKVKNKN